MASILIIEDEENLRFSVRQALKRAGHDVAEADAVEPAWELTRHREFDAVLTDVNLGGESGIDLVKRLRDDGYDGVVVVMTAYGTVENAVAAMKLGADDYLQKPVSLEELVLLTERLLEHRRVRRRLSLYQRMEAVRGGERVGVIGESPVWKETLRLAERLAAIPVQRRAREAGGPAAGGALPTILILGETGSGKGMLARHIHEAGAAAKERGDAPYVHINCSALPPTLIESELFGHEKGAFTDAKAARAGLFEMAEGGTVFLDEIGDMPLDLQAKLLTVVEDGIYRRVGGSRDKTVCARVIAATNQDLEKRVEEGKFRRDLLYRLNAFTVRIPALRDRPEDAVLMAEELLSRFQREYGRTPAGLSEEAKEAVRRHRWPGNVRELINACQRVAMLCDAEEIAAEDLGLPAPAGAAPGAAAAPMGGMGNGEAAKGAAGRLTFDFERGLHRAEEVERELIVQALERTRGNVSKAAKLIGMQRSSFRYRIDRFELHALVEEMAKR